MKLKRFFFAALGLTVITWSLLPQVVLASKDKYFDFGPYYNQPQVLGFSFSSLENLPVPKLPDNIMPQQASGVMPGSPFYPLEQVTENIQLAFTFDPIKKEELRLEFASERLSEAKTLMEQGKVEAASIALDNYNHNLKDTASALSNLAGNAGAAELANKIEEVASTQIIVAQSLALSSHPAEAEEWNLVAKAAQRALDRSAEVRGEPAIPEELSTGIQKLKEQGLISEEESNKLYSLENRGQVREELDKLASSGQFPASELIKLDTAVAQNFPDVHKAMAANMQVAELRVYQTLPQPSEDILKQMKEWEGKVGTPPSNDIKPYLWHNRAEELARGVDLSYFPSEQQGEVAKLLPQAITNNPTYIPAPSPSPSPSPAPQSLDEVGPSLSPTPVAEEPTPTPPQADPYLGEAGGALPGEPTYLIKQLGENFRFAFTFDPAAKARLKMQQAERRLAEAASLSSDPKKSAQYGGAIKDYQEAMADASKFLKDVKDEEKAQEVAEKLESQAARHEAVLEKGLLPAPKDAKLIADAIKATEDALDRSADVQGRPALPPALSDRLGDLKAQGLILPEEAGELVRSNSRGEVREKVRKLVELGSFPLADSKKLDEAQVLTSTSDYNQLVEVRKVEELQKLRSVQSEFAQTPTLKSTATTLSQREAALLASIDPSLIKKEDLGGRKDLVETYEKLAAIPRPINSGQFGADVLPGAAPDPSPTGGPARSDAVLGACPEGAVFKQFEGCVWADTGKSLSDYEQYKCEGPRQYYSFAARKCVAYEVGIGFKEDAQPVCPVGYNWNWNVQSCQTFTGGGSFLPTPQPEPEPKDDAEREARSKLCPAGSSYQAPNGCVWDKDGKSVYDSSQYRCGRGQYYSFEEFKCITSPKEGEAYQGDATPACKEDNAVWSWSDGKCMTIVEAPKEGGVRDLPVPKPFLATPGSIFYPLKTFGEAVRATVAFTPEARQEVRASQARERLAEGYAALEKGEKENFAKAISSYTAKMQEIFNDVSKSSLSDDAKKTIGERLAKEAVEQNLILQKIEVVAKSDETSVLTAASSVVILGVDKAADLSGEPALPEEVKTKVEALPEQMISEEDKKKLLETNSRVEARLKLGDLVSLGGLTQTDAAYLNEDFNQQVNKEAQLRIGELKKLEEFAQVQGQKEEIEKQIKKNEDIVGKLTEFQKNFEVGKEIPADIRPYVRLTRIEEVAQTIRPDMVRLEDFQNRKDVILAVATLQEEFRPTKESIRRVEEFRRRNPNGPLPPELARIEALSFSLGVREQAGPCYLPSPPFAPNTPCPAPGAPIPVVSYVTSDSGYSNFSKYWGNTSDAVETTNYRWQTSVDKDGKPLVYGQGPTPVSTGACPDGYHWMYDSGGWCMSNSGNYNSSYSSTYTPSGPATPGYTPYTPYYTAPGASPATSGYPVGDNSPNDGCPYGSDSDGRGNCIRNSYPSSYSYSAPSYYGTAPTYYTTNPPAGTVPGSGPKPTSPGQCPSGFHWMSDSGGWCMADGPTYVPGGISYPTGTTTSGTPPPEGYNCGSQPYDPVTKKCKDGACPGGFNWDGKQCVSGGTYYSPNLTQSSCGPGYYWDGRGCIPTYSGSGGSGSSYPTCPSGQYYSTSARTCVNSSTGSANCPSGYTWNGYSCQPTSGTGSSCSYPSGGCPGTGAYYDYSSCSCKTSVSYSTPSSYQYGCTPGYYWNGSKCVAGSNEGSGWSDSAARSQTWCQPPSGGCGSNSYWDYGSCYCRSSSTYSGGGGSSPSNQCQGLSCGGGAWLDYSTCSCRYSGGSGTSSTGSTITCYPPSQGCPGGWYDYGTCSCKTSSSTSTYSSGGTTSSGSSSGCANVSASSCGSGWYWDSAACTCRQSSTPTSSGGTSSGGSSSGSCPSGYHWMSDNGGWCMSDNTNTSSSGSTTSSPPPSEPAPSTSTTTSSEPAPAPSTSTTTESSPPPSSEPAPSTSTESSPPPSQ